MRLPGADELFRATSPVETERGSATHDAEPNGRPAQTAAETTEAGASSGRVKHDAKVTVYMTADELLSLEHARLELRRDLGQSLDRGRLVREALSIVLTDYAERGADSEIARRLGDQ